LWEDDVPVWQRLIVTLAAMLASSFIVGLIWSAAFNVGLPSYIGGLIGGLVAVPTWEFLKRVQPKR
jgi:hypothetical protein